MNTTCDEASPRDIKLLSSMENKQREKIASIEILKLHLDPLGQTLSEEKTQEDVDLTLPIMPLRKKRVTSVKPWIIDTRLATNEETKEDCKDIAQELKDVECQDLNTAEEEEVYPSWSPKQVKLFLNEYQELHDRKEDNKKKLEIRLEQQERLKQENSELKMEKQEMKKKMDKLKIAKQRELKAQISDLMYQLRKQASKVDTLTEELYSLRKDDSTKKQKNNDLQLQLDEARRQLQIFEEERSSKDKEKDLLKQELDMIREDLLRKYKGAKENLADKVSTLKDREYEIAKLKQELSLHSETERNLRSQLAEARKTSEEKKAAKKLIKACQDWQKKEHAVIVQSMEYRINSLMENVQTLSERAERLEQERNEAISKMNMYMDNDWKQIAEDRMEKIDSLLLKLKKEKKKRKQEKKKHEMMKTKDSGKSSKSTTQKQWWSFDDFN